jgi:hypothetical protein
VYVCRGCGLELCLRGLWASAVVRHGTVAPGACLAADSGCVYILVRAVPFLYAIAIVINQLYMLYVCSSRILYHNCVDIL